MKTIAYFYFFKKIPIIRVDFNVPLNNLFRVLDNTRIIETIATIYKIIISDRGRKTIIISHFRNSQGEISKKYSLINIIPFIQKALKIQLHFCKEIIGNKIHRKLYFLNKEIFLLENIRFFKEESGNEVFAKQISQLGDFYVNDAFGVSHRKQTTITNIAKYFTYLKCFGALMYKEFQAIKHIVIYGKKPITAIIGGAKVSSKIDILVNILPLIDHLLIAGGMAFTFIKVLEGKIGNSIVENDKKTFVFEIFQKSFRNKVHVYLPIDVITADAMNKDANIKEQYSKKIPKEMMGLDIGKKSIHEFSKVINRSFSIFWNGPLGVFELTNFSNGTLSIIKKIKNLKGAFSMVGGGDSILSIKKYKEKISYISTGGGAMLEILKGKILPGVAAIIK